VDAPRILVVDDQRAIRELLVEALSDAGYRTASAGHGVEALSVVGREPPDLVLSDVGMPGLDGPGLVAALRARGIGIPVLLMSATRRHPTEWGVAVITKPFDLEDLLALVAEHLVASATGNGDSATFSSPRDD
jgi:CheY-like chemotaxis protein